MRLSGGISGPLGGEWRAMNDYVEGVCLAMDFGDLSAFTGEAC